jgi:hypothetical protein
LNKGGKYGEVTRYIDGNEVKTKKYGDTVLYFDGNEVKNKKYGDTEFYIDGSEIKNKKYGDVLLYIEDRVQTDMLKAILSIYLYTPMPITLYKLHKTQFSQNVSNN